MFRTSTTFVIGAGASAGLGLPVGTELKRQIAGLLNFEFEFGHRLLKGDDFLAEVMRFGERDEVSRRFRAAATIANDVSFARSIDDFIHVNEGDADIEFVGKLAIARAIAAAEKRSKIFVDPSVSVDCFAVSKVESEWHYSLFQMLQVPRSGIDRMFENVNFIVFNYDRCLEHFLFCTIKRFYRLSDDEAARVISRAKFYHPYGMIGRLPWMPVEPNTPSTIYGGGARRENFEQIARGLKTYSESLSDSDELDSIRKSIAEADKIVFLGFAFHQQNMDLIQPSTSSNARFVYLTAKDVSPSHVEIIHRQIDRLCGAKLTDVREQHVSNLACEGLLADYCRSIESS